MATVALQPSVSSSHSPSPSLDQLQTSHGMLHSQGTIAVAGSRSAPSPTAESPSLDKLSSHCMKSRLYPADRYREVHSNPSVRTIEAAELASALQFAVNQAIPESDQLFPWVHGVHPENHIQHAFFFGANSVPGHARPHCFRGIMLVKAGPEASGARLRGSVSPSEILPNSSRQQGFLPSDPKVGFSIRNFGIQVAKFATVSDIVVYGDGQTTHDEVLELAKRISLAQQHYRKVVMKDKTRPDVHEFPVYNTFVVQSPFAVFENFFPELVAVDSEGKTTEHALDFYELERLEMAKMSSATEIAHNVFLGCSADVEQELANENLGIPRKYDVIIEACDHATVPAPEDFQEMQDQMEIRNFPQKIEFPGSNSPSWKKADSQALLEFCQWVYGQANGTLTGRDGRPGDERRILIYCGDGYTESSLLGLAFCMYSEGLAANEAWLYLHNEKNRNFFAYPNDVRFLQRLQPLLLVHSPTVQRNPQLRMNYREPKWFSKIDGSLPSRILPHLYLGNLDHANNGAMLKALGIRRVLSIGEPVSWSKENQKKWGLQNLCISGVQDNGVDSLNAHIERCLRFIKSGRDKNESTLVHCRVGVSRSATICIAETMQFFSLSVPRAYCYVRARRLNVIIQPHCRFMYELLKWEESQRKHGIKREIEWPTLAREVARLNQPHAYY